ncbi:hypothetical protein AAF712_011969, partial [Marasmius tenuissimus]
MLVLDYYVVANLRSYIHAGPILQGCYAASTSFDPPIITQVSTTQKTLVVPRYYTFMSVPSLIVSFIMFILTVYKCGFALRVARRAYGNNLPFVSLFMRDGIFWFLAVF